MTDRGREDIDGHAAARSAEQARLAIDVAGLGTWSWRVDDGVVRMDARCREIVGLPGSGGESLEAVLACIHPDDRERVIAALATATGPAGPGRYAEEFRYLHADGSVH